MNLDTTHALIVLLGSVLGGGVAVHIVANIAKKVFGLKTSSVIHTMVLALAALGAGAQYVWQLHSTLPPAFLGLNWTAIYGVSQIVYRYSNYATNFLGQVRSYNASLKTTVANDAAVAAVVPPADATAADQPAPAAF